MRLENVLRMLRSEIVLRMLRVLRMLGSVEELTDSECPGLVPEQADEGQETEDDLALW